MQRSQMVGAARLGAVAWLALTLTGGLGCASTATTAASTPAPAPPPPPPPPPPPDHPQTWAQVPEFYGTQCPPPAFVLDTPEVRSIGGATWTIAGTEASRTPAMAGPLVIGVLGAVKDATDDTRKNLQKAQKAFKQAKVNLIIFNGDVAETAEITDVGQMLGELFGVSGEAKDAPGVVPVFVHSGNSEWTSGFTNAFVEVEQRYPNFFNLNFIRDVDLGAAHLVSLPGWSVRPFVKQGGCHYGDDDIAALRTRLTGLRDAGALAIITAHGPPRGPDKRALDRTHDEGNVGDEGLASILQDGLAPVGIFGHILEAGGRATADPTTHTPLPSPQTRATSKLYVNVGSASSAGLQMLNKKTARGLAAIVTVTPGATAADVKAKVKFIKLR